jgi:pimeloyl-ACP methyl ester carboxylesterase
MKIQKTEIICRDQPLSVEYCYRPGKKDEILYVHGLGCSKDDFIDAAHQENLRDYTLAGFDFPGCGNSPYPENTCLDIDDLVEITRMTVLQMSLGNAVIIGHSMGGLVALLYCERYPEGIKGFINIEGNLAPEDCFFSREAAQYTLPDFQKKVLPSLRLRLSCSPNRGLQRYADTMKRSSPKAFHDLCPSLVAYSDNGNLIERFLRLPIPKMFVYGSENRSLSYLPRLRKDCEVAEIADSGHFPAYDNPDGFYDAIANFLEKL